MLAMVAISLGSAATSPSAHANDVPRLRSGDELWEVSSRCLPDLGKCVTLDPVTFRVTQFHCAQGWRTTDESALKTSFQLQPAMRTIIYAHGNWMTQENTRGRASYVYNRAARRADEPIRFIIYSWPSQRDGRPLRDVYEKADRSNIDTYYFGHFLNRIPETSPLGILGFSFGGRVVGGGLHLVSGGQLEGRSTPVWGTPRQVHVSFVAPAFDRTWLVSGREYGMAMQNVEKLVNIYNSRDPVLRRVRFLDRVSTPIAAGFSGLADPRATQPLQDDQRIAQYDCGDSVGTSHDEMNYYQHCSAYNTALDNVLGK
ncbi:MAG: hypothetical protein IT423_02470 [Pirellulaceae bacterium]|nr:hypothetical protein [Pirellulaceae bacterium]